MRDGGVSPEWGISAASRTLDDAGLHLSVTFRNDGPEERYVIDRVQTLHYDDVAGDLMVGLKLSDAQVGGSAQCHFIAPSYLRVGPRSAEVARIDLRSVVSGQDRTPDGIDHERSYPVGGAKRIRIEAAWSDEPLSPPAGDAPCGEARSQVASKVRGTISTIIE